MKTALALTLIIVGAVALVGSVYLGVCYLAWVAIMQRLKARQNAGAISSEKTHPGASRDNAGNPQRKP